MAWFLAACAFTFAWSQSLRWSNATPYGIRFNASVGAWHSGRVEDLVDYRDGSVLAGEGSSGMWWANANGQASCLTDGLDNPDITAVERGPDGENHIYFSTSNGLYVSSRPKLDRYISIPLPSGTMRIDDIAILNGARVIVMGCDNGVWWSRIPYDLDSPLYDWRQAQGPAANQRVFRLSARSTGGRWSPWTYPTAEGVANGKWAVVNRSPVHRDLFWAAADGSIRSTYGDLKGWSGNTFSVTSPGVSHSGSEVAAVARGEGNLDIFFAGPSGELRSAWWNRTSNRWENGTLFPSGTMMATGYIKAISRSQNSLDVFYVSAAGRLMHTNWLEGRGWDPPVEISGGEAVAPNSSFSVVSRNPNHLDVFWIASSGVLKTNWWVKGVSENWQTPYTIPTGTAAAVQAGVVAVSRDQDKLDLCWVSANGTLMTTYWNKDLPEQWSNHTYALSDAGAASTTDRLALVSRHPLQLDLYWIDAQRRLNHNSWYAYSDQGFRNSHEFLSIKDVQQATGIVATTAFDDEIELYVRDQAGKLQQAQWTTSSGDILVGYRDGATRPFGIGHWEADNLVLQDRITLANSDGFYSTTSVSLSKYGTAAYVNIAHPMNTIYNGGYVPGGLHSVYKTTNLGGTWFQTTYAVGESRVLQIELSNGGTERNNTIAVSPVNNDEVYIGYVMLYHTLDGGGSWQFVGSPHVHCDIARVVYPQYDRSGKAAFFCTDGGVSYTPNRAVDFVSQYNQGLATIQCYAADGVYSSGCITAVNRNTPGMIAVGTQDNGVLWTIMGLGGWNSAIGGDGGWVDFLADGKLIARPIEASHALRLLCHDGAYHECERIPVVNGQPGDNGVNRGFSAANRVLESPEFFEFGRIYGYGWEENRLYALRSPSGLRLQWQFEFIGNVGTATGESIIGASCIDGDNVAVGTSMGSIYFYNRLSGRVTAMPIDWPSGYPAATNYNVMRLVMQSPSRGYALLTKKISSQMLESNISLVLKLENGRWRQVPINVGGTSLSNRRILGIDVDAESPVNAQLVALTVDDAVLLSRDGGNSWRLEKEGLPMRAHVGEVRFTNWSGRGRTLIIGTFGRGVWQAAL